MTARAVLRSADGRLRAPWRLLIFGLVAVALGFIALSIITLAVPTGKRPDVLPAEDVVGLDVVLSSWATVLALLGAHAFVLPFVEHRGWDFVWLHRDAARPRLLASGFLIGALAIGIPSAILIGVGWLDAGHEAAIKPLAQIVSSQIGTHLHKVLDEIGVSQVRCDHEWRNTIRIRPVHVFSAFYQEFDELDPFGVRSVHLITRDEGKSRRGFHHRFPVAGHGVGIRTVG